MLNIIRSKTAGKVNNAKLHNHDGKVFYSEPG
jgi:hypothetical protein